MTKTLTWLVESPDGKTNLRFSLLSTSSSNKYLSLEWEKQQGIDEITSSLTVCGINFHNYPVVLTVENARKFWDDLSKEGWKRKS